MENGKQCAIFGASGGIGAALVDLLAARDDVAQVHALARGRLPSAPKVTGHRFTLTDEASIAAACAEIGAPLDLVIVATGRLVRDNGDGPEKSARALDAAALSEMFAINAIGPALIAKHCMPLLAKTGQPTFAAISAKVGSITDNRLGGWHSYRASKAALNMLVRNFAIELARTNPAAIAVTLHPGTVDTPLSQPFQRGVPAATLFTPEQSAAHLLSVIDGLSQSDSGKLFAWNGSELPF
ncbi:NAD(P)-dependent dehydrogenase (short-subunit alcohol dehydrogenase family) [Novosphingobium hassiacum]|uniref:NAD(P)-dependent dehydrogenase (Short-subunit alcohol dehydrogenase family) n=1 Tax=Novosphingobium hassiacum TaxID=173676 RepID=A0A7W6EX18_9SPHN|nr:SDR family NAD(P)-dependent oxidoreductase [Novosphingobium hassiacum]MBB3861590.1 NAD(P)-dependent dehydrogenase (short-subunit alcohol dehydrogenase family) [Novosphingobium hassiacum]